MRGIKQRRYLTEKYQQKQVRLAYTHSYTKPYDRERYIRTEFSRKRRFYDILRGNYAYMEYYWRVNTMLGGNPHTFTREELGRLRTRSWSNCGQKRCCSCYYCNPRRGHWGKKELTRQEIIAEMHVKEELDYYRDENIDWYD